MCKIVGFRKADFRAKDGTMVKGYNVFTEEEILTNGKGLQAEKIYFSEAKLEKVGLDLDSILGREVKISYNRFGKVQEIFMI